MPTRCRDFFFTKVKNTPSNYPILYKKIHNWVISSMKGKFFLMQFAFSQNISSMFLLLQDKKSWENLEKILWKRSWFKITMFTYSKMISSHYAFSFSKFVFIYSSSPKKFKMMTNLKTSLIFEFHEFHDFIQFLYFLDGSSTMYGKYRNSYEKFRGCI